MYNSVVAPDIQPQLSRSPEEVANLLDGLVCPDDPKARPAAKYRTPVQLQQEIIAYVMFDAQFLRDAIPLVKASYFGVDAHGLIFDVVKTHYEKYKEQPSKPIIEAEIVKRRKDAKRKAALAELAELDAILYHRSAPGRAYMLDSLRAFAKEQILAEAWVEHLDSVQKGEVEIGKSQERVCKALDEMKALDALHRASDYTQECMSWGDLVKLEEAYQWLIEDRMHRARLVLLSGGSKMGKTVWLSQTLARMILDGWALGKNAARAPIIYLDFEMHFNDLIKEMKKAVGQKPAALLSQFFWYKSKQPLATPDGQVKREPLPAYLTVDYLRQLTAEKEPGLIVVDTFRGAFGASPEIPKNGQPWERDEGVIGRLLRPVADWCHESRWTVFVIHHDNRTGTFAGSGEFKASVDAYWHFQRVPAPGGDLSTDAKITIQGRGVNAQPLHLSYAEGAYQYVGEGSKTQAEEVNLAQSVKALLADRPRKKKELLASLCQPGKISPDRVEQVLQQVGTYDEKGWVWRLKDYST